MSRTALGIAAQRAVETERPGALFDDPWARLLAGDEGFRVADEIARTSSLPTSAGGPGVFAVRTRFYDDAVRRAVVDTDARQVVVLAAGMDTRAHRLAWPEGTVLYEVDRPAVFAHKEPRLHDAGAVAQCDRRIVATDLRDDWRSALRGAGFSTEQVTVWIVEGLLYYLADADVQRLLGDLHRASAAGSMLLTDVAPTVMRDAPTLAAWRQLLASYGEPFRSFSDDGPASLRAAGWEVVSATSITDVAAGFGHSLPAVGALGARRLLVARRS